MSFWANIGERLNEIVKRRIVAALLAMAMAGIMLGAFNLIDHRSAVSLREDLETHAKYALDVLHDSLVMRLSNDVSTLTSLGHYATFTSEGAQTELDKIADYQLQQSHHFIAIGFARGFQLEKLYTSQSAPDFPAAQISAMLSERLAKLAALPANERLPETQIFEPAAGGTILVIVTMPPETATNAEKDELVLAVVDRRKLLHTIGYDTLAPLDGKSGDIRFKIRDTVTNEIVGQVLEPLHENPLVKSVDLPGSRWEIRATPASGWDAVKPYYRSLRTTLAIAAISMLLPIIVAALLLSERNRNIKTLRVRETKLLELSQRFKLAMDSSSIGIWEIENDTSRCYLDERAASLHGYPMLERRPLLTEWLTALVIEDRSKAARFFFNCSSGQQTSSEVYRVALPGGTVRYLRSAGSSYIKPDGSHQTTGILWDVTSDMIMAQKLREAKDNSDIKNAELELALHELSSREHELEELSGRLKLALESYNCGIWEAAHDYSSAVWNERMCELYGLTPEPERHVTRDDYLNCLHPDERPIALTNRLRDADDPDRVSTQRVVLADGSVRYVTAVGRLHENRDGTRKIVGIAFDVTADVLLSEQLSSAKDEAEARNTELEQAKTRIEHNALHDPLTGLANRRKLDLELDALSSPSSGERKRFAILHLDLDRFKQINDTLGHAAGDAVLIHAAQILTRNVREGDVVARIGGDEFVILIRQLNDKDNIKSIAAKIISDFSYPFDFDGFTCRCGVSIGIAFADVGSADARRTLINADLALYRAKATGRNRFEFFTQNLQAEIVNHKRTADEILAGLERGEFEAWYQPQFCANTLALTGVEALVRWRHPVRGILTPDKFLKIAEEINVVSMIDQIVLQHALQDKEIWRMKGIDVPRISVNVSVRRLHDDHLIDSLKQLAIKPGEITFELVEAIFLDENEDIATSNIERIKALGIDIEIDDFGTGHTSIISLLRLKPKRLKIDRQLVMPILTSPQERSLVRSIVDIARSLGVETIAEGVETHDHAALLRQIGCDMLQGYAFSRPLPPEEFSDFAGGERWLKVS
ncbi:bifunctional diguanylate cyclase/phosphodiesterase [Agrobacterium rosae]|uniref:EAL domain-containing protein n=1 Tax=Agrobacterium rosae TaxID=1972867 RepID=A0AAW9FIP7_9HYPH|nr:EAL domain-containing protein [Agrobacterium rosae]MDX8303041.1 EAL domain-containing protein [Agrobacterium rosae]